MAKTEDGREQARRAPPNEPFFIEWSLTNEDGTTVRLDNPPDIDLHDDVVGEVLRVMLADLRPARGG